MVKLSVLLKEKRKELKYSLRTAAEKIGISHSYLSILEKGVDSRHNSATKPTPETLKLISEAYGISYDYLMEVAGYIKKEADNDDDKLGDIIEDLLHARNMYAHGNFTEKQRLELAKKIVQMVEIIQK